MGIKNIIGVITSILVINVLLVFCSKPKSDQSKELTALSEVYSEETTLTSARKNEIIQEIESFNGGNNLAIQIQWKSKGPKNLGGRTRSFIVDIRDPTENTAFAASASGGLWKTTNLLDNQNTVWEPVNFDFPNLGFCAIVQDPNHPNTIFAGTGEFWVSSRTGVVGTGIYKSVDGGNNWSLLNSTANDNFSYVNKLLFDQSGGLYACTAEAGIMKSDDSGITWYSVLDISSGTLSNIASDIELSSNGDLYAAFGGFQEVDHLYKSPSGLSIGELSTWSRLTLPGSFKRKDIACAPSDPNIVYAFCSNAFMPINLYRSDNGGSSWVDVPFSNNLFAGQANYNLIIEVSPQNPDHIIAGAQIMRKSFDGGQNWYSVFTHVDHHTVVFSKQTISPLNRAIIGNDGGIYQIQNNLIDSTITEITYKEKNYVTTQFYGIAVHPDPGSHVLLGGTQDNGTLYFDEPGVENIEKLLGGDGVRPFIDQDDPMKRIIGINGNAYTVSTNGGSLPSDYNVAWVDNSSDLTRSTIYDSSNDLLYTATNAGDYYRVHNIFSLSPNIDTVDVSGVFIGNSAFYLSPNISNTLYFNGETADLVRVTNAHISNPVNGEVISNIQLDLSAKIKSIDIENGNEDHIVMAVSSREISDDLIWESVNSESISPTWTSFQGNLPRMPIYWIIFLPNNNDGVLVGTEFGLWLTEDIDGSNTYWQLCSNGIPKVRVTQIHHRKSDNLITVATYGRGIYTSDYFIPNDECDFAFNIPINGSATANNQNATPSNIQIDNCPSTGSNGEDPNDVWFKFTTPDVGTLVDITIGINSSEFNRPVLQLVTDCSASTVIACDKPPDNMYPNAVLTLTGVDALEPDSCYYLRVWDKGNDETGIFEIYVNAAVPECPGLLNIASNPTQDSVYRASDTISSEAQLNNPLNIEFKAGDAIMLKPDFEVKAGASFLSSIEDCVASLQEEVSKIYGKVKQKLK